MTKKLTPRSNAWFVFICPYWISGVLSEGHPESFKKILSYSKQNSNCLRPRGNSHVTEDSASDLGISTLYFRVLNPGVLVR